MKTKYLWLYYISSFMLFFVFILSYIIDKYGYFKDIYDLFSYNKYIAVLLIINFILLIINVFFNIKKYKLDIDSIKFPIQFIIFYIVMIVLVIIINRFVIYKWLHFSYYYILILIDYILLNIYTLISYKKR